jgi:hypothetical protein
VTPRLVRTSQVALEAIKAARDCMVRDATVHLYKEWENGCPGARELTADRVGPLKRRADLDPSLHRVEALLSVVPCIMGKTLNTSLRPHLW